METNYLSIHTAFANIFCSDVFPCNMVQSGIGRTTVATFCRLREIILPKQLVGQCTIYKQLCHNIGTSLVLFFMQLIKSICLILMVFLIDVE